MKESIGHLLWSGLLLGALLPPIAGAVEVENSRVYTHPRAGVRIAAGQVQLPTEGIWQVEQNLVDTGVFRRVGLIVPRQLLQARMSERGRGIQRQRQLRNGQQAMYAFSWPLREYARTHDGALPASLDVLAQQEGNQHIKQTLETWPYNSPERTVPPPPYFALVKSTTLKYPADADLEKNKWTRAVNKDPLVVELHPLYPDGKHYVLYTNGRVDRVEIDQDLMAAENITVTIPAKEEALSGKAATVAYTICGLATENARQTVNLVNRSTGATLTCTWNVANPQPLPEAEMKSLLQQHPLFRPTRRETDSPILTHWQTIEQDLFGLSAPQDPRRRRRDRGNTTNMFNVFGGRAAMQETFQLEALETRLGDKADHPPVSIETIERIKVKSHPFEEMLGDKQGGTLALANLVPMDRFFLHIAQPKTILPLLDEGGELLSRLGSGISGRALDYGLRKKYFSRLGITEDFLKQLIQADVLEEFAVFTPDLFVIDGTDVTALGRVRNAQLFSSMLSLIGAGKVTDGQILALPGTAGASSYWTLSGDIFIVGTHRSEVERVVGLAADDGAGSLGKSAEFRFMLTELPLQEQTRAYAYFSDAFIRRLISPEVKIAQVRRLDTMADLQMTAAAGLLYKAYGQPGQPDVGMLQAKGYLPENLNAKDISLTGGGVAVSNTCGTLNQQKTLLDIPVTEATPAEAEAYTNYVRAYSRYWRQFFDPIAVRFNDTRSGELEITTFILPLLDHSLYNQLKQVLSINQPHARMRVPQLTPEPAAMISLNLSETVWMEFLSDFFRELVGRRQLVDERALAMLDDLGPAIHFAVHDSDPIIAFGSGELMGMGGNLMNVNDDMLAIPMMLSLLTRPVTLAVELQKEDGVREFLENGTLAMMVPFPTEQIQIDHYQLTGKDAWIYGISFWGVGLRFQFALDDGFLLISNLPWGPDARVDTPNRNTSHCAELLLNPAAAEAQLAPMFTAAMERQRNLGIQGIASLQPLVRLGTPVDEARQKHHDLFGFSPVHPQGGTWQVKDNRLVSTTFGTPGRQHQPPYQPGNRNFGLLRGVKTVRVGMQFEDEGLRTSVRWTFNGK